ncbi:uncharacterized protein [Temnothorax longispinosus]|uniref:uncharacterized protein n=1 Tax=Temnothorax longispinosus TaxID=300112 RepID=UPI003A9A4B17
MSPETHPSLPCNRELAEKRLITTTKSLKTSALYDAYDQVFGDWELAEKRLITTTKSLKTSALYDAYDQVFGDWLAEGIIEVVPDQEIDQEAHYLPHRGVVKVGSTTPLRPVFNASAKYADKNLTKLMESFYVDNCVTSLSTITEVEQFIYDARQAMSEGAFDLRGWETSHSKTQDIDIPVLGLIWDKNDDTLRLVMPSTENIMNEKITKRVILSFSHRIYDPIGFVSPVMITSKLLLQQTWISKIKWDDEVCDEIRNKFKKWLKGLIRLDEIRFPRWAFDAPVRDTSITFHVFCDASKKAYAAVIFARVECDSQVNVSFVSAKARVAPVTTMTINRLELLATCMGVRLARSTVDSLKMTDKEITYWSDSSTVLFWIQRNCPWASFVDNRVKEIRNMSNSQSWRHIPGELNPADLPSRGCTLDTLCRVNWWNGPEWLRGAESEWPVSNVVIHEDKIKNEIRKTAKEKSLKASLVPKVEWKFNPPSAPWWRGWWERLIQILKRMLRKILGKACLSYEEMLTVLCDCESVINARPLTYLSDNPRDLAPITPSLFLQEICEVGLPDCNFIDREKLKGRFKYRQFLKEELRKRFRSEYLGQLKIEWPLGRVIELFPGKDGIVRVVRLITATGQLVRPVQRLYCLEVDVDVDPEELRKLYDKRVKSKTVAQDQNINELKQVPSEVDVSDENVPIVPYKTRSGRTVKRVERL